MTSPQSKDYRMKLNNHLQATRGVDRITWGQPIKSGPDDNPSWSIKAFLDGEEFCRCTGPDKKTAKEEAARQVLRHLLAQGFIN